MPDEDFNLPPRHWSVAFAALPAETPPADGWQRLAARLPARRRQRPMTWLATAAVLALAAVLPWRLQQSSQPAPAAGLHAPSALAGNTQRLDALQAESARLESLLLYARDERVSSATAAALAGELDDRVAGIDAALMQPGVPAERQLALWQARVDTLRSAAGFEGTRRWLAANGGGYDAALARVD